MAFRTDKILWYNNKVFGELGYGCPNLGDNISTLNVGIHNLVDVMGRNLSAIMQSNDVDLRTPPSINTISRVKKLCERARSILASRMIPANVPQMEATHATPAAEVFRLFPVPYFKVRNSWMKEWSVYILSAIGEAAQHTDNRKPYDISPEFAGIVGQYCHRVYSRMAVELLGADIEAARKLDYTIPDDALKAYDPAKYFTSTELIDTIPELHEIPTEDDLIVITDGIPAHEAAAFLRTYPTAEKPVEVNASSPEGRGQTSFAPPIVP